MLFLFPVLGNIMSLIMIQTFEGGQQSHFPLIMPNGNENGCLPYLIEGERYG